MPPRLHWRRSPGGLYRFAQGLHVIAGTAAIPLLVVKLWSVYPRLFLPAPRRVAAAVERASLVPLVGGSLFMLFTGTANIARWYPWPFFFPHGHYWGAWITIGALVLHIAARGSTAVRAIRGAPTPSAGEAGEVAAVAEVAEVAGTTNLSDDARAPRLGRRALLGWAGGTSLALTVVTAGQTVPFLRRATLFSPRRPDIGTEGLPVNRTADEAGVRERASRADWALVVEHGGRTVLELGLADLGALPRRDATLPIACVEGWSADARWSGVSVREVLRRAGISEFETVDVVSIEEVGLYSRSVLNRHQAQDRDTLLATMLEGEPLDLDHGYPVRLIGPNRPGVMQTKWVARLVVR